MRQLWLWKLYSVFYLNQEARPSAFRDMKLISKKPTRVQSYNPPHTYTHPNRNSILNPKFQKAKPEAEKEDEVGRNTCVQDARWVVDIARGCRPMAGEGRGRSPDLLRRRPRKGIRSRFPVHCMFMTWNQTGWKAGQGSFNPQVPERPSAYWADLILGLEKMKVTGFVF